MDKKTLCLYFQVHQPVRLRKYHFFDLGKSHDYYDDFANRTITQKVARRCYLPANRMMLDLIQKYGKNFKVSFSISGLALEQFEKYAPEVIESFKAWAKTGCVEFLCPSATMNVFIPDQTGNLLQLVVSIASDRQTEGAVLAPSVRTIYVLPQNAS